MGQVTVSVNGDDHPAHRGGGGRIHLSGRLTADATQTCVISLEPVKAAVDAPLEIEFWPETLVTDLKGKVEDPTQAGLLDWPEPIADGALDLGPVIYETLATALELYPKKEGTSFQWSQGGGPEAQKIGPFAALDQLRKR